ncbi:unnamed protein product [Hermetia illucens]|uniref:Uncharacterized protein n=1 Tax=Hermetia illucens TaxID=343691 RepID=A0A7R8YYS2_HERIL|nr:unnamed protein product [Hermetia illucens]
MAENNTPRRALFDLPSDNTSPAIHRLSLNSSLTWQNEETIRQRGRRSFDFRPVSQENRRISCRNPFPDEMEEKTNIEQDGCTIVRNSEENTFSPFLDKMRSISRRQSRSLCPDETKITIGPGKSSDIKRDEGRLGTPVSDKRRSFNKRQSLRRL